MVASMEAFRHFLQSLVIPKGWSATCISLLNASHPVNPSIALNITNQHGHIIQNLSPQPWGITYDTCRKYCGSDSIPIDFDFPSFASNIANYFLPWIGLCAQLPYESGENYSNVMSFFLAVGSPALVTYSLTLTILNRYWVRGRFDKLFDRSAGNNVHSRCPSLSTMVSKAKVMLQEGQQVPLRVSQEHGWLSSLLVLPQNREWWSHVRERLRDTRREVTPSLIAQILIAFISYVLTVISSFMTSVGNSGVALDISSGSLWLWLIPVIWGWILVGTQTQHNSIRAALQGRGLSHQAYRAQEMPGSGVHPEDQKGILVDSGLMPQSYCVRNVTNAFEVPLDHLILPTWNGADVSGDERRKGPIYNYSKVFTWWQVANVVEGALRTTLDNIDRGVAVGHEIATGKSRQWDDNDKDQNLQGDSLDIARYCGLHERAMPAYPGFHQIPVHVWKHVLAACAVAIFVQAGTTGPSIMIAYLTPTVGLSCRSAGYLIYGALGIIVWLCLLSSMLLSHWAMLIYQDLHIRDPMLDFRQYATAVADPATKTYTRTTKHAAICGAAVVLRYMGKFLAVVNGLWLIVTTLLEYIGAYDNCWCKGAVMSLGSKAWVVVFKNKHDLAQSARTPWAAGVSTGLLVCVISLGIFYLGSSDRKESDA